MIRLGIIGAANPEFREKYAPALERLQQKIRVSAIYDCVTRRAELAATACQADVCLSFEKLVQRPDVDAILFLSSGWYGLLPTLACLELRKPLFCSQAVWQECHVGDAIEERVEQSDSLMVIESQFRYWPSTLRSRELQATEVGEPVALDFCDQPQSPCFQADRRGLAEVLDWARFLLQRSQLRQVPAATPPDHRIEFLRQRGGKILDAIPLTLTCQGADSDRRQLLIGCRSGEIRITGPHRLQWRKHNSDQTLSDDWQEELLNEQSGVARQLDHFCRRVAGGLIPVHDITDAQWALHAAQTVLSPPE